VSEDRLDTKTRELLAARQEAEVAAKAAEDAKGKRDRIEMELFSLLEELGQKSATLEDGTRISRVTTRYADVIDKQVLARALKERGLEAEFLRDDLKKGELNKFVRTLDDAGSPLPPGLGIRFDRYVQVAKPRRRK
jgi:hypothetical protein